MSVNKCRVTFAISPLVSILYYSFIRDLDEDNPEAYQDIREGMRDIASAIGHHHLIHGPRLREGTEISIIQTKKVEIDWPVSIGILVFMSLACGVMHSCGKKVQSMSI
jgi:hypothetical protein